MTEKVICKKTNRGVEFWYGGNRIGTAISSQNSRDHIVPMGDGVFRWTRTEAQPVSTETMRFEADFSLCYQMMPALMYDGNENPEIMDYEKIRRLAQNVSDEGQDNHYFQGTRDAKTGLPWRLAYWNMSIPGAMYGEGAAISAALFLPPDQQDGAASLYEENEKTIYEMLWPTQNGPRIPEKGPLDPLTEPAGIPGKVRSGKGITWVEGEQESMEARDTFAVMLVFAPVEQPRMAWHRLLDESWKLYYKIVPPSFSDEELWDLGITYAKSLYDEDDNGFRAFCFGKMFVDGKWVQRPMYRFELAWCGQSLSNANSVLWNAILNGDPEGKEMAFHTFDSWISRRLPSGLVPTHVEEQEFTDRGRRIVDACNLGCGALQFFTAWHLARMCGEERPAYYDAAVAICDFAVEHMNDQGRIGKSWHEDDFSPVIESGTTGAFLTLALCQGAKETGRMQYLEAAKKSYAYYYDEFLEKGYTMGGACDIFTIDKESAIPLLKGALALYELTREKDYLCCAENAAYYLSTWQWCYTTPLLENSTLKKLRYDSFGGTSVSIHGCGNDPYALFYVHDLYDLAELTGNEQWSQRAHAAWRNGADGVSDGTMVADGRLIPPGGQHEARGVRGLYQWLVAWPTAFRLENLRRTMAPFGDRIGRTL